VHESFSARSGDLMWNMYRRLAECRTIHGPQQMPRVKAAAFVMLLEKVLEGSWACPPYRIYLLRERGTLPLLRTLFSYAVSVCVYKSHASSSHSKQAGKGKSFA
jgi:hypothetical protein